MMFLVHAAHRGCFNGNLWDLQRYYYILFPKSQENRLKSNGLPHEALAKCGAGEGNPSV